MKININNRLRSLKTLCAKCSNGMVTKGDTDESVEVYCTWLPNGRKMNKIITECTKFMREDTPTLYELKEIGWILNKSRNNVGFVKPKHRTLDEDSI